MISSQQQQQVQQNQNSGQNHIFLPKQYPDYSSQAYWDTRYRNELLTQNNNKTGEVEKFE